MSFITGQRAALEAIEQLKYFFSTAPCNWDPEKKIRRFLLPNGDYISCVLWNGMFYITGTDIVRSMVFRFEAVGRPVKNIKKFEEGVFSDLRNLKVGVDSVLEEPRSEFLEMLYKNSCIRTQKKQKVFFWFSVNHDKLFNDALERDLKRQALGHEPTTIPMANCIGNGLLPVQQLISPVTAPSSSFYGSVSPAFSSHTNTPMLECAPSFNRPFPAMYPPLMTPAQHTSQVWPSQPAEQVSGYSVFNAASGQCGGGEVPADNNASPQTASGVHRDPERQTNVLQTEQATTSSGDESQSDGTLLAPHSIGSRIAHVGTSSGFLPFSMSTPQDVSPKVRETHQTLSPSSLPFQMESSPEMVPTPQPQPGVYVTNGLRGSGFKDFGPHSASLSFQPYSLTPRGACSNY